MYYRFEYDYSYADSLSWGIEIREILVPSQYKTWLIVVAVGIQFCLWATFYLLLKKIDISTFTMMVLLFCGFVGVSQFYVSSIEPVLVRFFEGRTNHTGEDVFSAIAEISEDGIYFKNPGREVKYAWEAFYSVHDTERNIIFIGDTLHAVIPASCFDGFLEKDAFVRECIKKIPACSAKHGPDVFD